MVREEPPDQGNEQSVGRGGVEQEGAQMESRGEPAQLELSEVEEEDSDVPTPEDVLIEEAEDLKVMKEFSKAQSLKRSKRCQELDPMMEEDCDLCVERDEAENEEKRNNLWPYVFVAVKTLQSSGKAKVYSLPEGFGVTEEFVKEYEDAMKTLLGKSRPPNPKGARMCKSLRKRHRLYEKKRVEMQKTKSLKFHLKRNQRPGWHHKFGAIFPIYTSYHMIEYLSYVLPQTGFCFYYNMETNDVPYPEYDEQDTLGRKLIEQQFLLDPSFREEFVELVKKLRLQDGSAMSEEEIQIVYSIFDQMNSLYNLDFEHFLMDMADDVKARRKQRQAQKSLQNPTVANRWHQGGSQDALYSRGPYY